MEATTEASFPSFAFNHRTPALMGKLANLASSNVARHKASKH